ncbi:Sec-independent protein translocase protein TatB [Goodfellowiella coeruleoviolacea]|uniref:Sec-independent protein translocase protein TatB n=1 Tax=Goodfellowiella coeruleoviolacea TaxID=334858 RepID=A0AAE3GE13_9PSEU|nr:Sec-independent protein translocase protein TatB [Goodfellowiella coeruleoviolacea]MCP2165582.1 sec-independent protein translocase protein TatB [Goodfellowiella coeruleoviolacea]
MFENIGWAEILIIIVAGLFILGPERLPSAAAWLGRTVRQIREYATGAREQIRNEIGPEFDELRKPLEELRGLRNFDPRRAVTKHLLSDLDDIPPANGTGMTNGFSASTPPASTPPASAPKPPERPLLPGERPPIDPDAT